MASTVEILDIIRNWMQEKVCNSVQLKRPFDDNIKSFELVTPSAFSAYMPVKKSLPPGIKSTIPGVITAFEESIDNGEWLTLSIRLIHCVYSPGLHSLDDKKMCITPNNDGWRDLLNFMDKTRAVILKSQFISGISVDLPLTQGLYNPEEQTPELDPYYFGWITFNARVPSYPKSDHTDLL